jgi:acyl transferase domain-containing protein
MQAKPGAMAAAGLSWEEAEKHLVPGVVVACDSVTLSGDTEQLARVLHNIRTSHPDRPVTLLEVDRAYHSNHMAEVGGEYRSTMTTSGVVGRIPSIPFFSSVTGQLYPETIEDKLGPVYWQENLERPVRFREAISAILNHSGTNNPIFLEVGPHPALKGPVRQILTRGASKACHVSTLVRRQNGMEDFLATVGKLYTYGFEIDFLTLILGSSISDLPSYLWHHPESYWYESRVSKKNGASENTHTTHFWV